MAFFLILQNASSILPSNACADQVLYFFKAFLLSLVDDLHQIDAGPTHMSRKACILQLPRDREELAPQTQHGSVPMFPGRTLLATVRGDISKKCRSVNSNFSFFGECCSGMRARFITDVWAKHMRRSVLIFSVMGNLLTNSVEHRVNLLTTERCLYADLRGAK